MQGARPVRTAGLVLVGVAVVAVGLGVFALTSNGSSPPAASGRPPVTSTTTLPATTTTHPTTTHPTTTPSYPSGQTTTIAPAPTSTTTPSLMQTVPVRVYNNSLIKNLASMGAQDFRNAGYNVVFSGNYPQGVIPHSTAYFTSAPGEQQIATQLAQQFGMRVLPRFPGIAFASPGVIVILTEDFQGAK